MLQILDVLRTASEYESSPLGVVPYNQGTISSAEYHIISDLRKWSEVHRPLHEILSYHHMLLKQLKMPSCPQHSASSSSDLSDTP